MGRLRSEKIDQSDLGFQLNYLNCRTRPTDQMTNEGDVLGLVRLRYPLSVRFNFGYNRHILERGCEGEVPLAICGILLHSTALRCGNCVPTSGKWRSVASGIAASHRNAWRVSDDSGGCALLNFHASCTRVRTHARRRHDDPKQAFDYVRRIEDDASEDVSSTIIIMDAAPTLSATSSSDVAGVSAAAPLSSNRATPLPVLVRWKSQMSHGCHIHHLCMYTYLQPPSFHEQ